MRLRLSGLLALVVVAACESQPPLGPGRVVITQVITLTISPNPVPALSVGQSVQLTAIISGSTNQTATWSSSNVAVATVTQAGIVQCVAGGVAVIRALAFGGNAEDAISVSCIAIQVDFSVDPVTLAFTHTVGSSPCPQAVGNIVVTNTSTAEAEMSVTVHPALSADIVNFTLAAAASRTVAISFNCSTQTSFTGSVTFRTPASPGIVLARVVRVTGTINR